MSAREMFNILQAEDANETLIKKIVTSVKDKEGKELDKIKTIMEEISVQDWKFFDDTLGALFPKAEKPKKA